MKKLLLFIFLISFIGISQQAYYNDVNLTLTGIPLKNALATKIIATHTTFLSYTPGVWEACKVTDLDPDDATNSNVLLIYGYSDSDGNYVTDRTRSKNLNGGTAGTQWNREHSYAQSRGIPELGQSGPGSDAHHLRASDITLNGNRGNLKFVTGSGTAHATGGGWYPGDEWKGDVARMMMYMYLRYGTQCLPSNIAIGAANSIDSNMIELLLDWNAQDPVSTYEDNRNTFHESSNTYAQGNRNPFIDNPNLATKIWGGTSAEDRWNIIPDTEAPSTPTNLEASNITNTTVDLNWIASTDNVAVIQYQIFVNGLLNTTSTINSITISGLTINTQYNFTVYAKDAAGNTSVVSNIETVTTTNFIDSVPPSAITDLIASNVSSTGLNLSWSVPYDYVGVTSYDVFKDGLLLTNVSTNSYIVAGLSSETTYNFTVYAKDAAGNTSLVSNTVSVTTIAAPTGSAELFISEYIEGSGNNKALEIANFTGSSVNLVNYSVKKQINGSGSWANEYILSGTLINGDVYVITNTSAVAAVTDVANVTLGAPIDFNGNDPVGLFKNGVLIDIVGTFNNTTDFAINTTLRRKSTISAPNTTYTVTEWDSFITDTFEGLGVHNLSTLSTQEFVTNLFSVYPNPTVNNSVTISINDALKIDNIQFYNSLGQLIIELNKPKISNNKVEIDNIPSGMYIVKIKNDTAYSTKRLIVH